MEKVFCLQIIILTKTATSSTRMCQSFCTFFFVKYIALSLYIIFLFPYQKIYMILSKHVCRSKWLGELISFFQQSTSLSSFFLPCFFSLPYILSKRTYLFVWSWFLKGGTRIFVLILMFGKTVDSFILMTIFFSIIFSN